MFKTLKPALVFQKKCVLYRN